MYSISKISQKWTLLQWENNNEVQYHQTMLCIVSLLSYIIPVDELTLKALDYATYFWKDLYFPYSDTSFDDMNKYKKDLFECMKLKNFDKDALNTYKAILYLFRQYDEVHLDDNCDMIDCFIQQITPLIKTTILVNVIEMNLFA